MVQGGGWQDDFVALLHVLAAQETDRVALILDIESLVGVDHGSPKKVVEEAILAATVKHRGRDVDFSQSINYLVFTQDSIRITLQCYATSNMLIYVVRLRK